MKINTERLSIVPLEAAMARELHENSLDEDTRRFLPDEVFETVEEAAAAIAFLRACYETGKGPLVYAVLLPSGEMAGYVQAVPLKDGKWEAGYHIGRKHTGKGYATEALSAFLPVVLLRIGTAEIEGVCCRENAASLRVLEKCGFVKLYEGPGSYQGAERQICRFRYGCNSKGL